MTEEKKIAARECKFAIHLQTKSRDVPDMHLVKEVLHFEDGTTAPNIRWLKNYKRPFYVAPPQKQNYKQKKESELKENLIRYDCTQSDLRLRVSYALGKGGYGRDVRELSESPYLYGTDISSTVLIKHDYQKKWPDATSAYRTAFLDSETDVNRGTDETIIITLVSEKKLYTFVQKWFVEGYANPEEMYYNAVAKYIQADLDELGLQAELHILDSPVDLIKEAFAIAHRDSPDFVAIWNMDYDIPKFLEQLKKAKVDPKDIFSDPKLPDHMRFCKYKKGSTKKRTASGQVKPKKPSEQWHSVHCPAGFYIIDAMCSYRFLRQGDQELPDYGLDTVLKLTLGERKMNFTFADAYVKLKWHQFMQKNYPFEYMCYAGADVTRMMKLERKTNDLASALPVRSGCSDFADFALSTKRFADDFGLWLMDNKDKVPGTVGPSPKDETVDEEPLSSEDDDDDEDSDEDFEVLSNDEVPDYDAYNGVLGLRQWMNRPPAA